MVSITSVTPTATSRSGVRATRMKISPLCAVCSALYCAPRNCLNADSGMRPVWKEFLSNLTPLPTHCRSGCPSPGRIRRPDRISRAGRKPAVKAGPGILPDQKQSAALVFSTFATLDRLTRLYFTLPTRLSTRFFKDTIDADTAPWQCSPNSRSRLQHSAAPRAVRHLIPNQIRTIRPERNTAL